jgi:hypothetical protein
MNTRNERIKKIHEEIALLMPKTEILRAVVPLKNSIRIGYSLEDFRAAAQASKKIEELESELHRL